MNIYDFCVEDCKGNFVPLREYAGKVILIVNSATKCAFTPQYYDLQSMYEKYMYDGFVILEFPSNQFENQAPESNSEIASMCEMKYGVRFPHFAKILVNGEYANPLFKYLQTKQAFKGFDAGHPLTMRLKAKLASDNPNYENEPDIKWNFTKFLIDRDGEVVNRFEPTANLDLISEEIEKLL